MTLTQHIGYGQFHLEDLLAGEKFTRFDGSLARVCKQQPYQRAHDGCNQPYLPDHVWVWVDYDTSDAHKVFLHRTAQVHALSPEQARRIERRRKSRRKQRRSR